MQWRGRRESSNVEDRRGSGGSSGSMPGGRGVAVGGFGTILIVVIGLLMGADPAQLLQQIGGGGTQQSQYQPQQPQSYSKEEEELAQFVKVVLADCEDIWIAQFRQMGKEYRLPKLVLFSGAVQSGCGNASSQVGPFYCPADEKIYIDLSFYQLMKNRFKASGDFAMAYVIAHEVGHHVQNILGVSGKVHQLQQGRSQEAANDLSVRLELQADFFAGVWAHDNQRTKKIMEEGDLEEALRCAQAIGDDQLQKQAQGYVVPESFTHGTSEQRMYWFKRGFETGDIRQGDTFKAAL